VIFPAENGAGEALSCGNMPVVCGTPVSKVESLGWSTTLVSDAKGNVAALDAVTVPEINAVLFPRANVADGPLCCGTVPVGRNRLPLSEGADCVAALDVELSAKV
jgi:hypothetical protein